MVSDCFGINVEDLCKSVNPDEAVAYGAAVQCAILTDSHKKLKNALLLDVTAFSLGIEVSGGQMQRIIQRNSTIPCKRTHKFATCQDNQTGVRISVYEGESQIAKENRLLGTFDLTNIKPEKAGKVEIQVVFDVDAESILKVTANDTDEKENKSEIIISELRQGLLTKDEMKTIVNELEMYDKEDKLQQERIDAKNALEGLVYQIKRELDKQDNTNVHGDEKEQLTKQNAVKETLSNTIMYTINWIDMNPNENVDAYQEKIDELKKMWDKGKVSHMNDNNQNKK